MNQAVGLATYILKKTTSHFYRVLVLFFSDKSILRLSLFERKMRPLVKWFWQMLCYWPKTSSNDWGYGAIRLKEKGRKRAAVVLHLVFAFWYGQNGKSRMRWLNALSCEGFVDSVHIWETVLIYHLVLEFSSKRDYLFFAVFSFVVISLWEDMLFIDSLLGGETGHRRSLLPVCLCWLDSEWLLNLDAGVSVWVLKITSFFVCCRRFGECINGSFT